MADFFWVGGGSSINSTATNPTNWSLTDGGSNTTTQLPATGDYLYFKSSADCRFVTTTTISGFDMTGYTGTMTGSTLTSTIQPTGNIDLVFEGNVSSGFNQITFAISGSNAVNVNIYQNLTGTDITARNGFIFNNPNANFTLMNNLRVSKWDFTNGTLDVNGYSINLYANSITSTCNFGSQTYGTFEYINGASSSSYLSASGTGTIADLTIQGNSSSIFRSFGSSTITVTNSLIIKHISTSQRFRTLLTNASFDVTSASTVAVDNSVLYNVEFISGASIDLSSSDVGDLGGNTISSPYTLTFPAGTTQFWTNTGTGTLSVWDSTNWTSRLPLPQDDAIMNTSHAGNVKFDFNQGSYFFKSLDMSGITSTGTITYDDASINNLMVILGDFTGNVNIVRDSSTYIYILFAGGGTHNISNLNDFGVGFAVCGGSTLNIIEASSIQKNITYNPNNQSGIFGYGGTINLNGNTFTCSGVSSSFTLVDSYLNIDSGNLVLTGDIGSSLLNTEADEVIISNDLDDTITVNRTIDTYDAFFGDSNSSNPHDLGTVTIFGNRVTIRKGINSFKRLNIYNKDDTYPVKFDASTTFDINSIDSNGEVGSLTEITSTSTTNATLNYTGSGLVELDYIDASYITGTPESTWYVGNNSVDSGNNVNLIFASLPKIKSIVGQVFLSLKKVNGVSSFKKVLGIGTPSV